MAFVNPYTDQNAHGSVANAYSFRRSRGRVILEKKPRSKQDPTPIQSENRYRFSQAVAGWFDEPPAIRDFFTRLAAGGTFSGLSYYLMWIWSGHVPPAEDFNFVEVINASLIDGVERYDRDCRIDFAGLDIVWQNEVHMGRLHFPNFEVTDNNRYTGGVHNFICYILSLTPIAAGAKLWIRYLDIIQYPHDLFCTLPLVPAGQETPMRFLISRFGSLYADFAMQKAVAYSTWGGKSWL